MVATHPAFTILRARITGMLFRFQNTIVVKIYFSGFFLSDFTRISKRLSHQTLLSFKHKKVISFLQTKVISLVSLNSLVVQ